MTLLTAREVAAPKREYHILNLGAGVQSTTLYLMFMRGEIKPQIDCAIFADTQEEPDAVYLHLEWLKSLGGPEIMVRTKGKLGDDLINGIGPTKRFASIPAFTDSDAHETEGRASRQCSKEYKTEVIERTIRREVLGIAPKGRVPRSVRVNQYIGISLDEAGRAYRVRRRFEQTTKWATPHFPLIDRFWTRPDCLTWQTDKIPHVCPRSACVFCPNHGDAEWFLLRETDPDGWARAVSLDHQMRIPGVACNRALKRKLYLHRSCQPLDQVQFDTRPTRRDLQMSMSFATVCEGVCGV